jgi:hypothetical protein
MAKTHNITQETMDAALATIAASPLKRTMHGGAGHWYAGNPAGSGPSVRVGSTQVVVALAFAGRVERRGQYYYLKGEK